MCTWEREKAARDRFLYEVTDVTDFLSTVDNVDADIDDDAVSVLNLDVRKPAVSSYALWSDPAELSRLASASDEPVTGLGAFANSEVR